MPEWECIKKCQVGGRLYRRGDIIEAEEEPNEHFRPAPKKKEQRIKAKNGYTGANFLSHQRVDEIEQVVITKLPFGVSQPNREKLRQAINLSLYKLKDDPPRLSGILEALRRIEDQSLELSQSLYELDIKSRRLVSSELRKHYTTFKKVKEQIDLLYSATIVSRPRNDIGREVRDEGGRPAKFNYLRPLIWEIARIFEDENGTEPTYYRSSDGRQKYTGSFTFIDEILVDICVEWPSEETIRLMLKEWKDSKKNPPKSNLSFDPS